MVLARSLLRVTPKTPGTGEPKPWAWQKWPKPPSLASAPAPSATEAAATPVSLLFSLVLLCFFPVCHRESVLSNRGWTRTEEQQAWHKQASVCRLTPGGANPAGAKNGEKRRSPQGQALGLSAIDIWGRIALCRGLSVHCRMLAAPRPLPARCQYAPHTRHCQMLSGEGKGQITPGGE